MLRVVVSRRRIARRVARLGRLIGETYDGRELTVVAVLTGAMVFLSDLIRHLPGAVCIQTAFVRSYPGRSRRSGGPQFALPLCGSLRGREVLVVDDILDTGQTLAALHATIRAGRPRSLRTCVLLRKARADRPDRPDVDFVGFDVDDEFVVGYGLDFNNRYRNLPDLCVLTPRRRASRAQRPARRSGRTR
jgi:hypoxanthine phosphoribosyltransferase